jgi:hypothetical protein
MRLVHYFLVLALSVAGSKAVTAGVIATFKVAGSTSATTYNVDTISYPTVTISFDPATLTVDSVFDAGNIGLSVSDTLTFAGGSLSYNHDSWSQDMTQDLPFVNANLVTFTTSAGSFSYSSEKVNILPNYDPSAGYLIPGLTISDGDVVAYSRGTINGPGGSAPANFMLFVDLDSGGFGNSAWALYSPEIIPYANAVPEPGSMAIATLFLGGGALRQWRKRQRA